MKTKTAVNKAFNIASKNTEAHYTPHSAKHSIASERDRRPLTALERKAWSENMGHDTEQITDRHYAKLSNEERKHVMSQIGDGSTACDLIESLTDEELGACVRAGLVQRAAAAKEQ